MALERFQSLFWCIVDQQWFRTQVLKIGDQRLGTIPQQEVAERPRFRIRIDRLFGISKASVISQQAAERIGGPPDEVVLKLSQPRGVRGTDCLPTFTASQVGRLKEHGQTFADPERVVRESLLQATVVGQLMRRFVNDRGDQWGGLRLRKDRLMRTELPVKRPAAVIS